MILKCKKPAGCKPICLAIFRRGYCFQNTVRKFTSLNDCLSHFWTFSLNCALNIKKSLMQISLGNILYLKNVVLVSYGFKDWRKKTKGFVFMKRLTEIKNIVNFLLYIFYITM